MQQFPRRMNNDYDPRIARQQAKVFNFGAPAISWGPVIDVLERLYDKFVREHYADEREHAAWIDLGGES